MPPMRINAVHRAILENQRAIMWALAYPGESKDALLPRIAITDKLTFVPPKRLPVRGRKPKRIPIYRGNEAFMSDVGEQKGWK